MIDIITDTLIDSLKLIPFLFIVFLLLEYFEHHSLNKSENVIKKAGKFGPILGSICGALPQCGFSVAATNLYVTRIISLGTLISIYLSTSDEMLPIFISEGAKINVILGIIGFKIILGIVYGIIIDYVFRKDKKNVDIKDFCMEEHCDCEHDHNIVVSALKHTINILIYIMIVSFILNLVIYYLGEDTLSNILLKNSIFGPFLASIIGLIPNCAASVVITELYLSGAISFGSTIAGLLTGSGLAILVLFKINKNLKENIKIVLLLYFIGSITGLIIDLIGFVI